MSVSLSIDLYELRAAQAVMIDTELDDASSEPIHLLMNWRPPAK